MLGDDSLPLEFGRAAFGFYLDHKGLSKAPNLRDFLELFERAVIVETLTRVQGSQAEAARFLGLKNTTLNMKIKRHHVHFSWKPI